MASRGIKDGQEVGLAIGENWFAADQKTGDRDGCKSHRMHRSSMEYGPRESLSVSVKFEALSP